MTTSKEYSTCTFALQSWNTAPFWSILTSTILSKSYLLFNPCFWSDDSHGHKGELLFGEVEGVIGHRDAVLAGILSRWQISPQDGVVGHTEERHHAVPCLVIEPHLRR